MRISRRSNRLAVMELASLLRTAEQVRAIDIALGIPYGEPPQPVVDAAISALRSGQHQYCHPAGLSELRDALAKDFGRRRALVVDPVTELTVTCGATEALFVALLAVTDPGDEVIVVQPFYESYPGTVELAGAVPVVVALRQPGWRLHPDDLERALSERTRAVILNTPHNPTGRVFDADELAAIFDLCQRHDVMCIVDEVYEHYVFEGREHLSLLTQPNGRRNVVLVGSLSKTLKVSGWRIGFCVAEPDVTAAIRRVHDRTTIGTNRPLQHGASMLAEVNARAQHDRHAAQEQRDQMVERLTAMGFDVVRPEGGWFLLAGTRKLGIFARALCRRLVEEAGVLLAPGAPFFADAEEGEHWVRITFIRDPVATGEALDRLERWIRSQPAR